MKWPAAAKIFCARVLLVLKNRTLKVCFPLNRGKAPRLRPGKSKNFSEGQTGGKALQMIQWRRMRKSKTASPASQIWKKKFGLLNGGNLRGISSGKQRSLCQPLQFFHALRGIYGLNDHRFLRRNYHWQRETWVSDRKLSLRLKAPRQVG